MKHDASNDFKLGSEPVKSQITELDDASDRLDRDVWVEQNLAKDFIRNSASTLKAGILLWLATLALLHSHVDSLLLGAWAVLFGIMLAYRYFAIAQFQAIVEDASSASSIQAIRLFFYRHAWSWWASAGILGSCVFLFYGKAPPASQYLCLMLLAVMGIAGAAFMAPHPGCQRSFSNALTGVIFAGILAAAFLPWPALPSTETAILAALVFVFRQFILNLGSHLHTLQASSYKAQFGNEQLIQSLRQQTQTATDAVHMKNSLLASATHDLRQPVHALAFYADWLRSEPQLADSIVPKILVATDSVNTLFNSLFDFAKIESGALPVNMSDVDIEQLMEELTVQYAPAAQAKGLEFETLVVQATVRSDPILLRRIVANLLANAIRYTDAGGVVMSASIVDGQARLEVSDTGSGISVEHLPHVFKEFYRAQKHQGTADSFGLGLAIVQRLCQVLGHVVTLRSTLGKGTTCRVDMQLIPHAAETSTAHECEPAEKYLRPEA
jgi:signal transduction histidine kinase